MHRSASRLLVYVCAAGLYLGCSSSKNAANGSDGGSGAGGSGGSSGASGSGGSAGATTDGGGGDANNPDGAAGMAGSGGTAGAAGADADAGPAPTPVFCPEADPFSPKNANSVVISDTVLGSDAHWTADKVYLIGDDFKIQGHTLTVDAGTTICLYQYGRILVGQGIDPGEIHLNGTADKPIVITAPASAQNPGAPDVFHRGIQFDTYMNSSVSYVNIWYGGPGGGTAAWALELTSAGHGTDPTQPLLLDHVTFGEVQSKGIAVRSPLGVAPGSSVRFTGYFPPDASGPALDAVARLDIRAAASFNQAFTYAGAPIPAAAKHVILDANADDTLDSDADLTDIGLPYLYANHQYLDITGAQGGPGATLTVHEGVTLQMSGALIVGTLSGTAQGDLVVAGTAAKPVTLTSAADTPATGDWEGIYFVGGQYDPTKSKIDHAQILYAGLDNSDPLQVSHSVGRCGTSTITAAVMITGGSTFAPYPGPSISNTLIAHSAYDGIAADASLSGGYLSNDYATPDITFQDIAHMNLETGACP